MKWMIGAGLLLGGCATDHGVGRAGPWKDFYNAPRPANIPKDVRAFVVRAQGCGHFSGEEGYDAERAAYLKKVMDELCPGLEAQRIRLLTVHAGQPSVLSLIEEVTEGYSFP